MSSANDRKLCIEVFTVFMECVKYYNEKEGFNSLPPCVILVGEKESVIIPPEVLTDKDICALAAGLPDICENIGKIVGVCAGVHVQYHIATPFRIAGRAVFETEDFYSVMNVILDRNGGSPQERTLVFSSDGHIRHVSKMPFAEPFLDELGKMKFLANCITSFNIGWSGVRSKFANDEKKGL